MPLSESKPAAWFRAARWLGPAVALLLFAQWPLRDALGAGSLLANDAAQCLFALYVALAVAHASRCGAHIAAHPHALARARWRRVGAALLPLPWCGWLLVTSASPVWASVTSLESFPESYNPGYFLIKLALIVLTLSLLAQCLRELRAAWRGA